MSLEKKSKEQIIAEYQELDRKYQELSKKYNILDGIVSNTNFDFWKLDKQGNMLFASQGKEKIVGYSSEEALKMNLADFFPEFEHERAFKVFQEALQGKGESVHEFMAKHKDGYLVPLEFFVAPSIENGEIVGIQGIARDISIRKKIEKARDEIERKLTNIIEHSTNVFFTHDSNGFLTYMSPQVEKLLGYKPEEIIGKWSDYNTDNPINKLAEKYTEKAIKTGQSQPPYEIEQYTKDGEKVWIEVRETPIVENGKTVAMVGSLTNITKRKQAEQKLKERENFFKTISEQSTDYAYSLKVTKDRKFEGEWYFGAFEQITGYSLEELSESSGFSSIIHQDDFEEANNRYEQILSGKTITTEYRILAKNGDLKWLRDKGSPVYDEDKKEVIKIIGVVQDITEEKIAKQKLEESEKKFKSLAESSRDYIMRYNREFRHTYMNPAGLQVSSLEEDDIIGKTHREAGFPEDLCKLWEEKISYVFENCKETSAQFTWNSPNGTLYLDWQLYPELDKNGKVINVIGVSRDITQLKKIEEELRENEEKLQVTFNSIGDAVITTDVDGKITKLNPTAEYLTGWNEQDALGKPLEDIFKIINSKSGEKAHNPVEKVLQSGRIMGLANHTVLISKNGSKRQIADSAAPIRSKNNEIIGVVLVFRDVTEEYHRREELKKSRYQLARGQKIANFGSWEFDFNNNKVEGSEQARIIYGIEDDKDFSIENIQKIPLPKYRLKLDQKLKELIQGISNYDVEFEIQRPNDGQIRLVHSIAEYDQQANKVYGIIQDITEQRETEEALRQSEENFRLLAENARDFIIVHDLKGTILYANPMAYKFTGYTEEEVNKMTLMDFIPPDEYKSMFDRFDQRSEGINKQFLYEVTVIKKNGERVPVEVSSSPIERHSGKVSILLVVRDISERKEFIRQLEIRNSAMDSSIDGIGILDENEEYIYLNDAHANIYGYESPQELLGKSWKVLYSSDELVRFDEVIMKELQKHGNWQGEAKGKRKDGSLFDQEISLTSLNDGGLICIVRDITERKQVQKKIERNEKLLEETGRLARIGGWEANLETNELFWTNITKEIHEVDKDYQPSLETAFDFYVDHAQNELREAFNKSVKEGVPYDLELEFRTHKGNLLWVRVIGNPEFQKGKCVKINGIFQDITNRKEYEKAIKESELKYRQLVENINDLVWEVDEKDRFTFINARSYDYLGLPPDEVIGKKCSEFLKESERSRYNEFFTNIYLRRKPYTNSIFTYIKSDGSESIWESSGQPRFNEKNEFIGFRGISRDITERKKAEDALKESEEKNKALSKTTFEALVFSKNGYCIECNDSTLNLFGYDYDEFVGMFGTEIIAPGFKDIVKDRMLRGYEEPYEAIAIKKDGTEFWAEFQGKQYKYKGESIRVTAIRDISERKQAEIEILKAKEKAEESDALKSAFLANMSHEIRTPMNSIIGFAKLLEEPELSNEERMEYSVIINNKSRQLLTLINDIIDISKIESGIIDTKYRTFNLNEIFRDIKMDFSEDAINKNISLNLSTPLPDKEAVLDFDPARLKQMLTNLVSNAIKFTDEGSVTIGYETKKSGIKIYVEDTGIGIDPVHQEKIFERFRQIDNAYTKQYGGTGLGLAIVKELVDHLKGKIKLISEPLKGSKFIIKLPCNFSKDPENKSEPTRTDKDNNLDLSESFFLVVEDEFTNYKLIEKLLVKRNANLIWAKNGKEAVDLFKEDKDKIDMILMDMKMPVMDGYKATRIIKDIDENIPIIALTAYAMAEDEQKALDAGCDEYLSKPLSIEKLFEVLKNRV